MLGSGSGSNQAFYPNHDGHKLITTFSFYASPHPLPEELSDNAAAELLSNVRLGAPQGDAVLVQLLSQWARKGREGRALRPLSPLDAEEDRATRASLALHIPLPSAEGMVGESPRGGAGGGEGGGIESAASSAASFLRATEGGYEAGGGGGGGLFPWGMAEGTLQPSTCELRLLRRLVQHKFVASCQLLSSF